MTIPDRLGSYLQPGPRLDRRAPSCRSVEARGLQEVNRQRSRRQSSATCVVASSSSCLNSFSYERRTGPRCPYIGSSTPVPTTVSGGVLPIPSSPPPSMAELPLTRPAQGIPDPRIPRALCSTELYTYRRADPISHQTQLGVDNSQL